jgi:sugar lactone lactonase YvrE
MPTTPVLRVSALLRSKVSVIVRHASLLCAAAALTWAASAGAQGSVQHFPGPVAVGTTAATQTVTLTVHGTVASIRVLTQGEAGLDFQDAGGGSCTTQSYPLIQACTVNVTVSPTASGRRSGAVQLVDGTNHVLASQAIDVAATGPRAVVHFGLTSTVAGISNDWRYRASDEGMPAISATIYLPQGVVADDAGVYYISDTINARIRKVDKSGNITTYAGIGYPSNNGDNGPATAAGVSGPTGLALDGAGNLYIADSGNNTIRRVDAVTGMISTVAGQSLASGWTGDGFAATSAELAAPNGVAFDADGNLYIADTGNNAIRRVDAVSGVITTIAGGPNATAGDGALAAMATLKDPWSLTFGPDGLLYIADLSNHAVRRIDATGHIQTVAGVLGTPGFDGDGGLATSAHLKGPAALVFDPAGNLYVADSGNNRIRRVDAISGKISSIIGNGLTSYQADGQNANLAMLYGPYALSMDGKGNIYIADYFHNVIRFVSATSSLLEYDTIRVSKTSAPQQVLIDNDGNKPLTPGLFDFDQSALSATNTTCGSTMKIVAVGAQCTLGVEFAPTVISPVNGVTYGSLTMHSDASNTPDVVTIYGQVLSVEPTQTVLSSSLNPAAVSQGVTFTAVVSETQGATVPTGTVTFLDGSTPIGPAVAMSANGIATITTSTLSLGQHTITASYSGDASNASVVSNTVTESIVQSTQISVVSSLNPSSVLQDVTFRATLTAGTPVTSGVITFLDGGVAIGTGTLTSGTATFTTHTLSSGAHQITASFPGDVTSQASTSAALTQTVNRVSSSTLLSASPSTAVVGTNVTLTATVTSNGGPVPTGTVTFKSGPTILGTGTLDANGSAVLVTSTLVPGSDVVTAVYAGDNSNLTSTSVNTTVTVNRLSTNTALASSAPSANAGSTVQLTATVTVAAGQTAVGTLSGIVTFYDGATVLGSQSVTNGSAVLSTSTLTVGSHNITASYGGSINYDVSASTAVLQTVQTSTSTTLLSLSSPTLAGGKPLTMTATVNTAGVKATGNVTFTDGATVLGTSALNAGAVATLTVTTLAVGPHNIVATYNADLNYGVSASATAPVSVTLGNTVLTLTGSAASAVYGTSITLTTSLTSDAVLAANPSVILTDNGSALATLTLSSGRASFVSSTLSVGTHVITAQYAGDSNNAPAQSQTFTVTITAATTTTTLMSSAPTSHFGDTVTLQANVASGLTNLTGSVTFQEGGTNLGTVAINASGVASLAISNFSVAQHSIVAVYSGDSTHATSSSTALVQAVVDPTTVSISSSANPAIGGNAVTFTAQVAGAAANSGVTTAPTGTIVFHEGANILGTVALNGAGAAALTTSTLTVGSHNIIATYSGDIRYAGNDSVALTESIRNASSQSVLTTSSNPAVYSAPLVLTVHVTGNGGAPTGNVNFLDGTTTIGQAALSANGTAVFTTSTLAPGIHSLTAIYVGDSNNSTSTAAAVNEQIQQVTQISVTSSSNPALTLAQPTLTATVSTVTGARATGNVRFLDGSKLLGTSALAGGVATLVPSAFAAGTHSITAAYDGDTSDLTSVSAALQLVVNLRPTQNTVTATLPTTLSGGVLTLISVLKYDGPVSPTGVTTFSTASGVIGSSSVGANGIATLNVQGSAIPGLITASYSGDASYSASVSSPTDITTSSATNFTLSVTPTTFSVVTKQYATALITIHSNDGFSDTINLGCGGLPYAATCTFEHDSIKLPADGTVTVKVNIDTGSPLTSGGEASASVQTSHGSSALALLPAGAVLALLAFGRRRRNVPALLLLLLAACLMPVIGCGSIDQQSTPAGKYSISISAVGEGTGVTLSQGLSMTVTQ